MKCDVCQEQGGKVNYTLRECDKCEGKAAEILKRLDSAIEQSRENISKYLEHGAVLESLPIVNTISILVGIRDGKKEVIEE